MLHVARQATGGSDVEPGVAQEIQRARGGGQALDQGVRGQMESSFEADFSGVRVHTDSHADTLNRSLNARAFTTGRDVFFRQGAYNPGASSGRELLAHELTHVVQQTGGSVRAKMVVNQPGDRFEQEADQAARAVIQREQLPGSAATDNSHLQRQSEEEEEPVQARFLQRQAADEEEPVQARLIQRQIEEDEASVQTQRVQRQTEDEEPVQAQSLQRQAEEEPVQTQLIQRQTEEDDESVQTQRIQRQTEEEEPVQTQIAQRQADEEEPVQTQLIQRRAATASEPSTAEAEPTEAEKAAALAAARVAEQLANQALAEGKNEVVKSRTAQAEEKTVGQAAQQEAEAKATEVPAEAAYAAATQTSSESDEQPAGDMTDEMAGETAETSAPTANGAGPATAGAAGAVNGAGPGAVNGKAPASAEEDKAYQAVIKRIKGVADTAQTHAPAQSKADESQAAAESPAGEIEGKAQANQVDAMEQAEAPPFDAAAFKAQLMERIAALAPKTVEEADNFKKDNKLGGVKSDMQARAQEEQTASQAPMEAQTAAPPDTSSIEPKPVTPLSPAEPGPAPPDVGAASAAPKSKGASEVEAPLAQNSRKLDDEMGEVEESDLEKSNEPAFLGALASKREAQTHAQTAPQEYRQFEGEQTAQAETAAAVLAQDRTQAMHGDRAQLLSQVAEQQGQTKSADEQARDKVAADIQKIYDETKTNVETILSELDGKVEKAFDEGAAAAKQVFEGFVKAKMDAYKERRYGGWLGWARWAKDKLLGMPSEVNAFYRDGRDLYLRKMDAVIDNVVAIVGTGITEAKAEIASGKQRIQEFVEKLPEDLQSVGQQAAADIQDQFADLEQSVADKQNELADTLANKYQENLQAIDARIEEMKAANQGLVDKAINAVVGVVKAILKLKDLLLGVLAKIASVVTKIIKAPIEFLGNLVKGVKQGFTDFLSRIGTHLQTALVAWLTGALGPMNIQIPDDLFSLRGIFSLVMQVLGLTWDYIRAKAVKLLGEPVVKALETGFEVFQILIRDGVAGLWEFVKEQFTNLKEMVIDQIKEMVITEVIKAGVKWILGLLNPAGAFIKAAMAIYEIVKFFIERGSQILEMVNAFIDAVAAIASGAVGGAAKLVENALAKALPVVIGFLASLLGISGLAKKVQKLIMSLRKRIDKAIDKIILRAKKFAKKLLRSGKVKGEQGKFTEKDRQAGQQAFATAEKKYLKNGKITHEGAQNTARDVKKNHPVFKSITVVDGKDTWDYQYIFRTEEEGSEKSEEEKGKPIQEQKDSQDVIEATQSNLQDEIDWNTATGREADDKIAKSQDNPDERGAWGRFKGELERHKRELDGWKVSVNELWRRHTENVQALDDSELWALAKEEFEDIKQEAEALGQKIKAIKRPKKPSDKPKDMTNTMRFQVQWGTARNGNGPTFSEVERAPSATGVTVSQAVAALDAVLAQVTPEAAKQAAEPAKNAQQAWVRSLPPAGLTQQNRSWSEPFDYGGYSDARVDVENMRGHNLRE